MSARATAGVGGVFAGASRFTGMAVTCCASNSQFRGFQPLQNYFLYPPKNKEAT